MVDQVWRLSLACATIITNRGGLPETTRHPIIIKKLDANILYNQIKKLIKNSKLRRKFQILNYKSFYLTHEYVSNIIDKVRLNILENLQLNKFNIIIIVN